MSTYFVTFRIDSRTINGRTYSERRQSLLDHVVQKGRGFWDETTSFVLVESPLSTTDFVHEASKGLSAACDMVMVFDPDDQSAAYFGDVKHPDVLASFLPKLRKAA